MSESVKVTSSCKRWKVLALVATALLGISVFLHAWSWWSVWRTWDEITPALRLFDEEDQKYEGPFRDYFGPRVMTAFIGTTDVVPDGWLLCDGKRLQEAEYPRLYDAIGRNFTAETELEGTFRLPDYRGMFVMLGGGVSYNARLGEDRIEHAAEKEGSRHAHVRWLVRAR